MRHGFLLTGLVCAAALAQDTYVDQMAQGANAMNAGDLVSAIMRFRRATELAPSQINGWLHLANAVTQDSMGQRDPARREELTRPAKLAWQSALDLERANKVALQGMAVVAMSMRDLDEAREWAGKLLSVDPKSRDANYLIGVIEWTAAFPIVMEGRADAPRSAEGVERGLAHIRRAVEADPNYTSALAFENLLLRLRAKLAADSAEAVRDFARADDLVKRVLVAAPTPRAGVDPQAAPPAIDPALRPVAAPPPPPAR